jgi:hypothetical protein
MAMSLLATHLKLNRDGETFSIGGKAPQPNQESFISRITPSTLPLLQRHYRKCCLIEVIIELSEPKSVSL